MEQHERAFRDIKDYYNDITSNNIELIKSLKQVQSHEHITHNMHTKLTFEHRIWK